MEACGFSAFATRFLGFGPSGLSDTGRSSIFLPVERRLRHGCCPSGTCSASTLPTKDRLLHRSFSDFPRGEPLPRAYDQDRRRR